MRSSAALLLAALPAFTTAQHYPGDPISVASYGGNWTVAKGGVSLTTADGAAHFNERGMVRVSVSGTVNKKIQDGNVQWTFSEQGVPGKETSGSFGYFKCNKQDTPPCNPATPMYLTIDKPTDMVGSAFTFSAPLQLPYKQKTGQMTLSLIATDEDHSGPADFTLGISFNYTQTESTGKVTLGSISQVQGGGKTECKQDVDCPSSYCMNGDGKSQPYHCHDCGENCCNSDADCPGSYCMDSPGKVAPYTCH